MNSFENLNSGFLYIFGQKIVVEFRHAVRKFICKREQGRYNFGIKTMERSRTLRNCCSTKKETDRNDINHSEIFNRDVGKKISNECNLDKQVGT